MIITLSLVVIAGFMMPMHYSLSPFRANNITTGTNNTYPIYLSGVPKGNGTYQQLITIKDPSKYGINANGSNIGFYDGSNNTHLYAWIQSINSTSLVVWIKNYNSSSTINMQVLPSFENLFSENGYLGKWNTTTDNGKMVFLLYQSWAGLSSLPNGWHAYGNSSDTIVSYYPNHINLRTTGDGDGGANAPYTADIYTNFTLRFPVSLYSYMDFYMYNLYGNENQFGIVDQSFLPTQSAGYFMFGGYGGGTLGYVGLNLGDYNTFFEAPNSNLLYELTLYNSTTNFLNVDGNSYSTTAGGFSPPYYLNYYYDTNQTNFNIYYTFAATYVSSMPTFTIGTSLYHSIDFKLIGSSTSFQWSISINGTIYNATSSNIYLNMTNGYYNIIVNLPSQYSAIANGVLKVNNANEIFRITVVSQNSNNFSNDIMYAIILASIIIAVALYFSRRN